MRFNWGHKLILVFLAFGTMMSYMVYRSTKTNYDLVSPEYYKDEIAYQQVIDGAARANNLSGKVSVRQSGPVITIRFPGEMKNNSLKGSALFYCSYDARRDKKILLNTGPDAMQEIDSRQFVPGYYILKLNWLSHDEQYYSEQTILIQ
ncbi:MAG TPA: FixH family protein [Chitinophagaceae bacterium]|nr:FixH family protein [Chitinophagaceae bacterium]